jgi:hypothetical protein
VRSSDSARPFFGQSSAELEQLPKERLGVDAPGVVFGDELFEALHQVNPRGIEADERGDPCREQRTKALGSDTRPSLTERLLEPLPVHRGEVEQGLGVAIGDQVLLGGDGFVKELLDAPHDAGDVSPLRRRRVRRRGTSTPPDAAELIRPPVRQDRLVEAIDQGGAATNATFSSLSAMSISTVRLRAATSSNPARRPSASRSTSRSAQNARRSPAA